MNTIYIEQAIAKHPQVLRVLQRFPKASIIYCEHYGEVFNVKAQNFRVQKQQPCLILAKKTGHKVLPTPESFGIGGTQNYYFSHMLNCLYDCRYCFLQGMYPSANYVLFVNYEDFQEDIKSLTENLSEPSYFFSGYDCDSLAYEPVTQFVEHFLPFFQKNPKAILELRTKSTNIKPLLHFPAIKNCIVAFSLTPDTIAKTVEHRAPTILKRLEAMKKLADNGWLLGLRFDPLIYHQDFYVLYKELIDKIFQKIPATSVHSISVGPMRFPIKMYQKLVKLYPREALLAQPMLRRKNNMTYPEDIEKKMKTMVLDHLAHYINSQQIFECHAL